MITPNSPNAERLFLELGKKAIECGARHDMSQCPEEIWGKLRAEYAAYGEAEALAHLVVERAKLLSIGFAKSLVEAVRIQAGALIDPDLQSTAMHVDWALKIVDFHKSTDVMHVASQIMKEKGRG